MASVLKYLPELEGMEMMNVSNILNDMNEDQAQLFATVYRARRKDNQLILLLALLGFVGFAGIHRFILGHIGLGILYLLTAGLCFIGTIVDLVNFKSLAAEYNYKIAVEVRGLVISTTNSTNGGSNV
ncbi:TM2 domain-containing protein [Penaeicola halotolerans]|uniref:TM2 domain-containing protein n=1 Tax=Penaeicola halotolerans TaxID=2793196 RepID=UPI001CF8465D|nr:TM2 domain-containing protein [Penaeicola halotolerans]